MKIKIQYLFLFLAAAATAQAYSVSFNVTDATNATYLTTASTNITYTFFQPQADNVTQEGGLPGNYTFNGQNLDIYGLLPDGYISHVVQCSAGINSLGLLGVTNTTTIYNAYSQAYALTRAVALFTSPSTSSNSCSYFTSPTTSTVIFQSASVAGISVTNGGAATNYLDNNYATAVTYNTSSALWMNVAATSNVRSNFYDHGTYWTVNKTVTGNGSTTYATPIQNNWTLYNFPLKATVKAPGYFPRNINVTNITSNFTTALSPINLLITVYDEATSTVLSTTTTTITYYNDTSTRTTSTTTGIKNINATPEGTYTFQFSAPGYSTRTYDLTITNLANVTLNAYLTNASGAQNVTFTVQDIDAGTLLLENVMITMQRLIGSNWTTIQTATTDISGSTTMSYTPSTRYYFIVSKTGYNTKTFYLDPVQFPAYTIKLSRTTTANNPQDFASISTYYEPHLFRNAVTNDFNLTVSEPGGTLTSYSVTLTYPGGSNSTSGTNPTGETMHLTASVSGAAAIDFAYGTLTYSNALATNRQFNFTIPIDSTPSHPNTIATTSCTNYGLGAFECATIATVTTIIVGGVGFLYGGPLGSGALVIIFLGFFAKIGFFSIYAVLGSILVGFAIIAWRSSE